MALIYLFPFNWLENARKINCARPLTDRSAISYNMQKVSGFNLYPKVNAFICLPILTILPATFRSRQLLSNNLRLVRLSLSMNKPVSKELNMVKKP